MGLPQLWEAWEVKFLLLSSLAVQVILLIFTQLRLYVSRWPLLSAALNGIVWLLYQTADDVAIYVLGHMSLSSKPRAQQQLMAFWASLLLVHLGGQDTITAYSMEDNNLWLRHSFTLLVQAIGAAYVLWKYAASGSGAMLAAAVFMLVVGVAKYAERVYALYSSRLDSISKSLQDNMGKHPDVSLLPAASPLDAEAVLQGAHDLFHLCKGQFADNKMWPSRFESEAISAYHNRTNPDGSAGRSMLFQLAGTQLSLMRDILYTKAVVIHTRYGCVSRIASIVSIIVACFLFRQSTMARAGYNKGDIVVTYVLLAGAFFLEVASVLRAFLSTWTCAWSKAAGWNMLHEALVCLRRGVKVAQRCRKLSGRIGQHDLMELHLHSMTSLGYWITSSVGRLQYLWKRRLLDPVVVSQDVEDLLLQEVERMVAACGETYVQREPKKQRQRSAVGAWLTGGAGAAFYVDVAGSAFAEICAARADEVVAVRADGDGAGPESERVEADDAAAIRAGGAGAESEIAEADAAAAIGAGGIAEADDANAIGVDGAEQQAVAGGAGAEEPRFDAKEAGFDGTILAWHYATSAFLCMFDLCCSNPSNRILTKVAPEMLISVHYMSNEERERLQGLAKAIHVLSRYMVFLLTERPHLLPSPVRRSRYDLFCAVYYPFSDIWYQQRSRTTNEYFTPALNLAYTVLDKCEIIGVEAMLGVLSQVWVEMLCYAASHCSSDSHARQLNSSSELITVIWILMNTMSGRSAAAPSSSTSSS